MPDPVVILGAGGFGRHILSILRTNSLLEQFEFLGFIDDGEIDHERLENLGAPILGTSDILGSLDEGIKYVIGIGAGEVRRRLDKKAKSSGLTAATIIHPDTSIAADVSIEDGVVICAGVRITTNVVIGRHVHLNMNVTVGHDVLIEDFGTVFPQVALGGESRIGQGATLGAGSCINPSLSVGRGSYVASGAVVIDDVSDWSLVAGIPAQPKKMLR